MIGDHRFCSSPTLCKPWLKPEMARMPSLTFSTWARTLAGSRRRASRCRQSDAASTAAVCQPTPPA